MNYNDIKMAVQTAAESNDEMKVVLAFIERSQVERSLRAYLEELEPPPTNKFGTQLTSEELLPLLKTALNTNYSRERQNIYGSTYRGISSRGSFVYDIDRLSYDNPTRLYVRIDELGFRGEMNEDDFAHPRYHAPNLRPQEVVRIDKPVSATMTFFDRLASFWDKK